jgi:hypothetical protein
MGKEEIEKILWLARMESFLAFYFTFETYLCYSHGSEREIGVSVQRFIHSI